MNRKNNRSTQTGLPPPPHLLDARPLVALTPREMSDRRNSEAEGKIGDRWNSEAEGRWEVIGGIVKRRVGSVTFMCALYRGTYSDRGAKGKKSKIKKHYRMLTGGFSSETGNVDQSP